MNNEKSLRTKVSRQMWCVFDSECVCTSEALVLVMVAEISANIHADVNTMSSVFLRWSLGRFHNVAECVVHNTAVSYWGNKR